MSEIKEKANKYFSMFLTVLICIFCIYLIIQKFDTFVRILVALIGFGVVVLVHEFGHFIVAKLTDIHVEAFSIGFPPMLAGILRTEDGYRIRILPKFFKKKKLEEEKTESEEKEEESQEQVTDEDGLCFYLGGNCKAGETEYQIGLVPFGGFVKMLGQEDIGSAKSSGDPRSYANKSVGVRMGVISAGVLFNVLSAVIIFVTVFLIGIKQSPPVIGYVAPGSPAARAGLTAGDEVIEVEGKSRNLTFKDITMAAALSGRDEKVALKVKREDGSVEDYEVTAQKEQTELGEVKLFGVFGAETLKVKKLTKASGKILYERTGLKSGDVIKSVNGTKVRTNWEMMDMVRKSLVPEVNLLVERITESGALELIESKVKLNLTWTGRVTESESETFEGCLILPLLQLKNVSYEAITLKDKIISLLRFGSKTKAANDTDKIKSDDIVLSIGDIEEPTYTEFRKVIKNSEDKKVPVKVLRTEADGLEKEVGFTIEPKRAGKDVLIGISFYPNLDFNHPVVAKTPATEELGERLEIPRGALITSVNGLKVSDFYEIVTEVRKNVGRRVEIAWKDGDRIGKSFLDVDAEDFAAFHYDFAEIIPYEPMERLYKADGPIEAIAMGYQTTLSFIASAYVTLQRFISGVVSPKGFMGPVGLITISYEIISKRPFIYYVYFIGLINAFIAVFNFLPLLPFDGGHFVFLLVEKVKGSAVSEKIQSAAIYAGWVVVGGFALYVTFNDIVRSFFS